MSDVLPIGTSWWQLIEARAAATPDRPFILDERGRVVTFGRFRDLAEEVAAGLAALGVENDHVVSWQLPTTVESCVLMAALCRLGVRQNPIIPILRRAEVSLITRQVASRWLFAPGTYRGFDFVGMAKESVDPDVCTVIDITTYATSSVAANELSLPRADPSALPPPTDPGEATRWYYFSSGTTASPKGAKHTDASVMASSNAQIAYAGLQQTDMIAVPFPMTHIGGIMLLTAYARIGARVFLIETFDPSTTPKVMSDAGVTTYGSATPFFMTYLAAQRAYGDEPFFPTLSKLHAGGAPITAELNAECMATFGTPIVNQWGLTEFPAATSLGIDDPPEPYATQSVGRMAPGAEVKVIDFDGKDVSPGASDGHREGELWVRGPQRCQGYVDASLDAEAFDSDGYFRTGDLGTVDTDGFVRITGRLKDIIIRNAENISALEIENVLIEHPAVADVAVIGLPDARTGERACAVMVLESGHDAVAILDLAAFCQQKGLAKQKCPEQIEFVDALPRNPMGKVLKHILRSDVGAQS